MDRDTICRRTDCLKVRYQLNHECGSALPPARDGVRVRNAFVGSSNQLSLTEGLVLNWCKIAESLTDRLSSKANGSPGMAREFRNRKMGSAVSCSKQKEQLNGRDD